MAAPNITLTHLRQQFATGTRKYEMREYDSASAEFYAIIHHLDRHEGLLRVEDGFHLYCKSVVMRLACYGHNGRLRRWVLSGEMQALHRNLKRVVDASSTRGGRYYLELADQALSGLHKDTKWTVVLRRATALQ